MLQDACRRRSLRQGKALERTRRIRSLRGRRRGDGDGLEPQVGRDARRRSRSGALPDAKRMQESRRIRTPMKTHAKHFSLSSFDARGFEPSRTWNQSVNVFISCRILSTNRARTAGFRQGSIECSIFACRVRSCGQLKRFRADLDSFCGLESCRS